MILAGAVRKAGAGDPMSLALRPHVHAAVLGDAVVLLDVHADRYFCVPNGATLLRPSEDRRHFSPQTASVAEQLAADGLALPSNGPVGDHPTPTLPTEGLDAILCAAPTPRERLRMLACLGDLVWRYRGRSFERVLAACSRPSALRSGRDLAETFRLAALFRRWVCWLPVSGKCLQRSFLLIRFLQRSGCTADWVFGVSLWPFAAHCWVQCGDVVLDDFPERLLSYEPILGVRG